MPQPPIHQGRPVITRQTKRTLNDLHPHGHHDHLNFSLRLKVAIQTEPQAACLDLHNEGRLTDNVLSALPKSLHPRAKAAVQAIWMAEDKAHALTAVKAFERDYAAKYPKAVAKITEDLDTLLEFYNYPAEHWVHLRTTNPIESTFATVRLRQRVTKGPGSRAAGVAMAFKLIEAAQARWRAVNAPHLVQTVRDGIPYKDGIRTDLPQKETAA